MKKYDRNKPPTNFKPAATFDSKHGTNLSQQYVYPLGLSADEIYETYSWCRLSQFQPRIDPNQTKAYCASWDSIVNNLRYVHFPYDGVESLDLEVKEEILCGMASSFNFDDIVYYSIRGIKSYMNGDVKDEIKRTFPENINRDIQWVISPETLEKMKDQIKDRKLSLTNITKEID